MIFHLHFHVAYTNREDNNERMKSPTSHKYLQAWKQNRMYKCSCTIVSLWHLQLRDIDASSWSYKAWLSFAYFTPQAFLFSRKAKKRNAWCFFFFFFMFYGVGETGTVGSQSVGSSSPLTAQNGWGMMEHWQKVYWHDCSKNETWICIEEGDKWEKVERMMNGWIEHGMDDSEAIR